jgi:hypothetical protein
LQMEWCLNCHRNPAQNIRPTSQVYNMAWKAPSELNPVWCGAADVKSGTPTAQSVKCTSSDPAASGGNPQLASLHINPAATGAMMVGAQATDAPSGVLTTAPVSYTKFTSQEALGAFLVQHYNIRSPRDLSSCEVCHR